MSPFSPTEPVSASRGPRKRSCHNCSDLLSAYSFPSLCPWPPSDLTQYSATSDPWLTSVDASPSSPRPLCIFVGPSCSVMSQEQLWWCLCEGSIQTRWARLSTLSLAHLSGTGTDARSFSVARAHPRECLHITLQRGAPRNAEPLTSWPESSL